MKLREWLKSQGWGSIIRLSRLTGLDKNSISTWSHEKRPIPPEAAVIIERETRGAVSRPEMLPCRWESLWPELRKKYNADGTHK